MGDNIVLKTDNIEIYDNDIDMAIKEACNKFQITDLKTERQRPWKAVLQYVGKTVFPDRNVLKDKTLHRGNNSYMASNYNKYNHDIILELCDYYIYISNLYDKFVSIEGFSYMINIPMDTILEWKNSEPGSTSFHIWKKLNSIRLESLKDDALDNGNVTGTMFVGNTEYGLNLPGVSRETDNSKRTLSVEQLPKLGNIAQNQQIEQTGKQDIVVSEQ